jgi:hypothetical protein
VRQSGNPDFLCPLYERALITNCDNEALWEEYFLHLEAEPEYHNRALYLLRSHATFFRNFSREIIYYWLELEEKESHIRCRDLYLELERTDRTSSPTQRISTLSCGTSRWRSDTRSS